MKHADAGTARSRWPRHSALQPLLKHPTALIGQHPALIQHLHLTSPLHSHGTLHLYGTHTYKGSSSLLVLLHKKQMRVDYLRSPSLLFDSENSVSLLDSLYKALLATSLLSVCLSNPKPFCAPARSLSHSTAVDIFPTPTPPGSSVLRTSPLPHACSPTTTNIITTQGKHNRANSTQHSSISYSKSYFAAIGLGGSTCVSELLCGV
ncbi:hypothetical protein PCANC_28752 [Puccinia coronata f. sp. avenae]|uniref:Uncharacterized protein n=1 Tax=Puccinia coronata f. sp. avenae TaxID=200324 RepID=A0A2N5TMY5_9BASI|nr:hypothetical protein PCANC_28752 [Puccinia coronata f. sp. avenae]